MKLWGVAMVRNEEDIVEAFVRHNLAILDGLLVVDHLSSDRTAAILRALCDERLPLVIVRNESPGYLQAEVTTTAAREAFARAGADFVFALEADEFLRASSRGALELALSTIPPGHVGRVARFTYVTRSADAPANALDVVRAAMRLASEPARPAPFRAKVVLTREFAGVADAYLTMGNRQVAVGRDLATAWNVRHVDVPASAVRICHLPVRSRPQYVAKIAVRGLAHAATGRGNTPGARWQRELDTLRSGELLDEAAMLRSYVEGGAGSGASATPATVVDPFLAPIELRHTPPASADALPTVLAAIEHMARRLSSSRLAPPGPPAAEPRPA